MRKMLFAFAVASLSAATCSAAPAAPRDPLNASTLGTIKSRFVQLMDLANLHDVAAIHDMFWQSPSALLVAKSAVPSEGNWAGETTPLIKSFATSPHRALLYSRLTFRS